MSDWTEVPLGELVDIFDSQRVPLSSAQRAGRKGPYPYYGAQGVIDHIDDFIFEGRYILVPEDGENLRSRKLPIAYFAEGQFWVNNHAHIIKAKPGKAVDRFVQSALQATHIGSWLTGAAQPKLSQAHLKRIPLLVPSFDAQQMLGSVLDAFDDLIENNRRRVKVLEEMARAIYREWFVEFRYPGHEDVSFVDSALGPVPEGWEISALGATARWLSGGTPSTTVAAYWDGEIPWITSGTLTSMLLDRSDRMLTELGAANGTRLVERDALLFVVRGMSLAKEFRVGIAESRLAFGQDVKALIASPGVEPLFLAFSVISRADEIQRMVEFAGHGTGKLSTDRLQAIKLALPPQHLQEAFGRAMRPLRESMSSLRLGADRLAASRDLLLPKLVTGQIDVSMLNLDALVEGAVA
ncbi:restriction endonuclease subunit S [Aeromicrobium sp. Leaf245]|uniref:restriction endonuclease subunit S n=1 Tax=Aeromicrobium sp. Leaf245 TaxID=1736306 RepID=UPI0006FDC3E2|nr:restriction endonuclease subunit S [Aeromicrobium sp. Leaf245]KQO36517.1 hypothetical protein ASF05_10140 [Aeromicrobium sp. Leaf245]